MLRIVTTLVIAAVLAAVASAAPELSAAPQACTTAQKAKRSKAVADYKKQMPKLRKAYFKRVKSIKRRKAFTRKQQAKLNALQRALAACRGGTGPQPPTVPGPSPRPVPLPPSPPPSPPPVLPSGADLALTIDDAHDPLIQWNRQTYTIAVTNTGPLAAFNVALSIPLPGDLRLLSVTSSRGSGACSGLPTVHCSLGGFASGESATVTVEARIRVAGTVTNSASVTSSTLDPALANNAASATTSVAPAPSLPPASSSPACAPSLVSSLDPGLTPEGPTDYGLYLRPQGEVNVAVIFVDFSDAPGAGATATAFAAQAPDVAEWYLESSYGRFSPVITPMHGWRRMPRPASYYGSVLQHRDIKEFLGHAVGAADPNVDFSPFDIVYVISTLPQTSSGDATAAALRPADAIDVDGVSLRHFVQTGTLVVSGVMVHELAHLFGLPDLYDTTLPPFPANQRFVGAWDPMSSPQQGRHMLSWHKWKLGWLDTIHVRCLAAPGQIEETITPLEVAGGVQAVVVEVGSSNAYVIEAREQIGRDSGLCDYGVLVYTVDGNVPTGGGPIRIKSPNAGTDPSRLGRCGALYDATLDLGPGEVSTFEDASVKVEVLVASESGYRVRVTRK